MKQGSCVNIEQGRWWSDVKKRITCSLRGIRPLQALAMVGVWEGERSLNHHWLSLLHCHHCQTIIIVIASFFVITTWQGWRWHRRGWRRMSRIGRCFFAGLRTFEMRMMLGEDYDDHHPHWHPVHDHHEHLRQRLKNRGGSSTASAATQAGHRAVVALQVELCLHAGVAGHHVHPSTCTVTLFSLFSIFPLLCCHFSFSDQICTHSHFFTFLAEISISWLSFPLALNCFKTNLTFMECWRCLFAIGVSETASVLFQLSNRQPALLHVFCRWKILHFPYLSHTFKTAKGFQGSA